MVSLHQKRRLVYTTAAVILICCVNYYNLVRLTLEHNEHYSNELFWLPSNTKGSAKMASFQTISDSLPTAIIDGTDFPRGINERSYMGVGVWNARMSVKRIEIANFVYVKFSL